MNELAEQPVPTNEAESLIWLRVYGQDACDLDDRTLLERVLDFVSRQHQLSDPACLAVNAALQRLDGRVEKALELYVRALHNASDNEFAVRVSENLCALYFMRRDIAAAEDVLARALKIAPSDVRLLAMRATLRAYRADKRAHDDIAMVDRSISTLSDLARARVYIRLSNAAHTLGNVAAAETYAQRAADYADLAGASRHAAVAYHILTSIYSNDVADVPLSLHYADLCADAAAKAGDKTHWHLILTVRYSIAAEIGDRAQLLDIRKQLESQRGAEKYDERFALVAADALYYAWTLSFDTMLQYLSAVNLGRSSAAQQAFCAGLRGIAASGCGDETAALKSAYLALSLGRPSMKSSLSDIRLRMLARTMGAAVLMRANRKAEAMRMFRAFSSRASASVRKLMRAVVEDDYSKLRDEAPDLAGYGLMFQALQNVEAQLHETTIRLTKREMDILQACAAGETARVIADKLSIDETTVIWHRTNLLKKLGVNRTLAAVAKGRSLRLIP